MVYEMQNIAPPNFCVPCGEPNDKKNNPNTSITNQLIPKMKQAKLLLSAFFMLLCSLSSHAQLYIVGDAVETGWSLDNPPTMTKSIVNENLFIIPSVHLYADKNFKFIGQLDWTGDHYGLATDTQLTDGEGTLAKSTGDDGIVQLTVSEEGDYYISVDTDALKVILIKRDGDNVDSRMLHLCLVGDATPGGWSLDQATALTRDDDSEWLFRASGVQLSEGTFKINKYGYNSFDGDCYFFCDADDDSQLSTDATDDRQWSISEDEAGTYDIVVDAKNMLIALNNGTTGTGLICIATTEGYATLFTDKAFVMPAGVKGSTVTSVSNEVLTTPWEYAENSTVPASTPLLLKGTKGSYVYNLTTSTEQAPDGNLLKGSVSDETTTGGDKYYCLNYASDSMDNIGFYWGATDGGAFTNKGGHAYLALPSTTTTAKALLLSDNTTTRIFKVEENTTEATYNLQGIRVANPQRGLYIVNGKKVFVK